MLSPAARNVVFMGDQWAYQARLGPWRYEFWGASTDPLFTGAGTTALRFGVILLLAAVSTRVGLWWGDWMAKVRR